MFIMINYYYNWWHDQKSISGNMSLNSLFIILFIHFRKVSCCTRWEIMKDASSWVRASAFVLTPSTHQITILLLEWQSALSQVLTRWKGTLLRLRNFWILLLRLVISI